MSALPDLGDSFPVYILHPETREPTIVGLGQTPNLFPVPNDQYVFELGSNRSTKISSSTDYTLDFGRVLFSSNTLKQMGIAEFNPLHVQEFIFPFIPIPLFLAYMQCDCIAQDESVILVENARFCGKERHRCS